MWWKTKPSCFTKEQEQLAVNYPSLNFSIEDNTVFIRGKLQIANIAAFEIEIKLPDDYPVSLPEVKELGGKIPIVNDRHVNYDGTCCLTVPAKMYQDLGKNYSIIDYISKFVIPFFANQIHYEINGVWANGDYNHGVQGIFEYYAELLEVKSPKIVADLMKITLQPFPKLSQKCPCESSKRLKKCHLKSIILLKQIPFIQLISDYKKMFLKS